MICHAMASGKDCRAKLQIRSAETEDGIRLVHHQAELQGGDIRRRSTLSQRLFPGISLGGQAMPPRHSPRLV